jgi:YD repeat-containing protein
MKKEYEGLEEEKNNTIKEYDNQINKLKSDIWGAGEWLNKNQINKLKEERDNYDAQITEIIKGKKDVYDDSELLTRKTRELEAEQVEINELNELLTVWVNAEQIAEKQAALTKIIIDLEKTRAIYVKQKEYIDKLLTYYREEEKKKPLDYIYKPSGEELGFDYYGRLVTIRSGESICSILYEYDKTSLSYGKIIGLIDREDHAVGFRYNASGQLSRMIDPQGRETKYEYNNLNRLIKIIYPDGTDSAFSYDDDRLSLAVDCAGTGVQYDYTNGFISRVNEFTTTKTISDGHIEKFDTSDDCDAVINGEKANYIAWYTVSINPFKTALVKTAKGITTGYVFEKSGELISTYTGNIVDDIENINSELYNCRSYGYKSNKRVISSSVDFKSTNYLTGYINENYPGDDLYPEEDLYIEGYIGNVEEVITLDGNTGLQFAAQKEIVIRYDGDEENYGEATVYADGDVNFSEYLIISGWACAENAYYIARNRKVSGSTRFWRKQARV